MPLHEGDELPFWGGLRVVHLPGHTAGHGGFFSAREGILFCGDLFASYGFSTHLPRRILNTEPARLPASVARVVALNPAGCGTQPLRPAGFGAASGAVSGDG